MLRMERKGVLCEGRVVIERDGFAQGGIDPPEHGEHDRDGFSGGLSGEPRGEGHAGFSFMQDEHGPRALAEDEVAFPLSARPSTSLGRSWMEARSLILSREGLARRGRRRL